MARLPATVGKIARRIRRRRSIRFRDGHPPARAARPGNLDRQPVCRLASGWPPGNGDTPQSTRLDGDQPLVDRTKIKGPGFTRAFFVYFLAFARSRSKLTPAITTPIPNATTPSVFSGSGSWAWKTRANVSSKTPRMNIPPNMRLW